jgi:hypothetical protein
MHPDQAPPPQNRKSFAEQKIQEKNLCPFGCVHGDEGVDEHGYCRHLVGFSNDGKTFEPFAPMMAKNEDGRLVENGRRFTDGRDPQKVGPNDRLVQISVSYRVYRRQEPVKQSA